METKIQRITSFLWFGSAPLKMEQWIRAIAGVFILVSLTLAQFHNRYWLFFTAFVGLNLFQSAFTKWCLMEKILSKLGIARPTE
jgi:Inner membrane protein YgaP-like, transmembrane domain